MMINFIRDDGQKFTLGGSRSDSAAWGITKVEGLGNAEYEISTEKNAVGDGDTITGCRLPARHIDLTANVKDVKNNRMEREKALTFFNPKYGFKMSVTRGGVSRWIPTRIEKRQCPDASPSNHVQLELALLCTDPLFYSADDFGKNIAAVTPGFGFPYISPIGKGFNVGIYNFAKLVEVENTGDAETYFTIRIEAFGDVENPKVVKDAAYIRLIDTLQAGDVVEVDMVANKIRKNGQNCIGKTDRTSSFSGMVLDVGDSIISFTADNGDTNMRVILYYYLRYTGA